MGCEVSYSGVGIFKTEGKISLVSEQSVLPKLTDELVCRLLLKE